MLNTRMMNTEDLIEENQECLQILADSDLRCSQYAEELLDTIGSHSSDSTNDPKKTDTTHIQSPENDSQTDSIEAESGEPERSIFAY